MASHHFLALLLKKRRAPLRQGRLRRRHEGCSTPRHICRARRKILAVSNTAWNLETRLIDFVLGDGYLFSLIPRNECCAAANQIRLFDECDDLLGFATL